MNGWTITKGDRSEKQSTNSSDLSGIGNRLIKILKRILYCVYRLLTTITDTFAFSHFLQIFVCFSFPRCKKQNDNVRFCEVMIALTFFFSNF